MNLDVELDIYSDVIDLCFLNPDDGALDQLVNVFQMLGAETLVQPGEDGHIYLHVSGCVNTAEQIRENAKEAAKEYLNAMYPLRYGYSD
jgi:hypothetical protein